jgi:hypothetical protein
MRGLRGLDQGLEEDSGSLYGPWKVGPPRLWAPPPSAPPTSPASRRPKTGHRRHYRRLDTCGTPPSRPPLAACRPRPPFPPPAACRTPPPLPPPARHRRHYRNPPAPDPPGSDYRRLERTTDDQGGLSDTRADYQIPGRGEWEAWSPYRAGEQNLEATEVRVIGIEIRPGNREKSRSRFSHAAFASTFVSKSETKVDVVPGDRVLFEISLASKDRQPPPARSRQRLAPPGSSRGRPAHQIAPEGGRPTRSLPPQIAPAEYCPHRTAPSCARLAPPE